MFRSVFSRVFSLLIKISIALPLILVILYMLYPLIIFINEVMSNPLNAISIKVEETRFLNNGSLAIVNATLIYNVPVTLRDVMIRIGDSCYQTNVLRPGNYTLLFFINVSSNEVSGPLDLEINFKIEGVYRVKIVVIDWLKPREY